MDIAAPYALGKQVWSIVITAGKEGKPVSYRSRRGNSTQTFSTTGRKTVSAPARRSLAWLRLMLVKINERAAGSLGETSRLCFRGGRTLVTCSGAAAWPRGYARDAAGRAAAVAAACCYHERGCGVGGALAGEGEMERESGADALPPATQQLACPRAGSPCSRQARSRSRSRKGNLWTGAEERFYKSNLS